MAAIVHTRTRADAAFSSQTASVIGVAAMLSISSCANRAATSLGATTSARSSGATSSSTRQPVRHPPRRSLVVSKASTGVGGGDDDDDDDVKRSNYKETSGAVKGLVSGLTAVVNAFGVGGSDVASSGSSGATRRERREARPPPSTPRNPSALAADIAREFTEAKYLWTGDINPEMYDLYCTFTDPTLSFAGLETFQRNLANLQPVLSRLVRDSDVELYSCELVGDGKRGGGGGGGAVRARWRMTGNLRVPWRPRIDLEGQTTFTFKDYGGDRGCLITAYQEEWGLSAGEAVMQLVSPFKW